MYEAMECLGGNGYVEESMLPRLYREAPVNAIWEGSGNVMCLDVLRALRREEEAQVLETLSRERCGAGRRTARPSTIDSATKRVRRPGRKACLDGECGRAEGERAAAVVEAFVRTRLAQPRGASLRRRRHRRDHGRAAVAARFAGALTIIVNSRRTVVRQAVERALQDIGGRVLVDDGFALGAAGVGGDERALDRRGR